MFEGFEGSRGQGVKGSRVRRTEFIKIGIGIGIAINPLSYGIGETDPSDVPSPPA